VKRTCCTLALTLAFGWIAQCSSASDLSGDAEALKLVERMLESLGGRQVWAEARSIEVELRGFYARQQEPWNERFWMDLETANGRFELRGKDTDRTIAWTPKGGWELAGGKLEVMPDDRHAFEMEYWKRQPFVMFHRLAVGGDTRVAMGDNEYRFDVFDSRKGELLAQFAVNLKGEPTKWGTKIDERDIEHVLGPLESFGNLRLPRWGTSLDGV
jgi:hypothetical protein